MHITEEITCHDHSHCSRTEDLQFTPVTLTGIQVSGFWPILAKKIPQDTEHTKSHVHLLVDTYHSAGRVSSTGI